MKWNALSKGVSRTVKKHKGHAIRLVRKAESSRTYTYYHSVAGAGFVGAFNSLRNALSDAAERIDLALS